METDQIFSAHCTGSSLLAQIFLNPESGRINILEKIFLSHESGKIHILAQMFLNPESGRTIPSANGLKSTGTIVKICQINSLETLTSLTIITFPLQSTGK